MEELTLVGKPVARVDALGKVTGRAKYGVDVALPLMLHAKVLRSKYPHARILSVDTSEAERLPGVKAVITAEDTSKRKVIVFGVGEPDAYPLAMDKVRFVGEEIAAVAADDELTAEEALGLIKVEYKVLNFAAAVDLGKAINPISAEGNTEGAIAQEIGTALTEEVSYEQGTVVNPNFADYRFPTAIDIPPIKTFLVETNDHHGPYGAKACGMTSNMPVAATLANAIYNAIGVRIKELPITPMRVLMALEEKLGRG